LFIALLVGIVGALPIAAQDKDKRLTEKPKHYNLPYHPWTPPDTKEAWEARKHILKEQLLVSQGLWPMPEKPPLDAVIHGKIERDGYTVEKVFFVSTPGHYVTGNLLSPHRPKGQTPGRPVHAWPLARRSALDRQRLGQRLKTGAEGD